MTRHYCEPFGGAASVLLNREPSPIETYNDLYGDVVNFFRVLRDQTEDLLRAIALTPYSREEFALALSQPEEELSDLERARRFYVKANQVTRGMAQTATLSSWGYFRTGTRPVGWAERVKTLAAVAARLARVQIENRPAVEVIKTYDAPTTLFFCDPPYAAESCKSRNAYLFDMTDDDHRALAEVLHGCKAKVAISGYRCALMDELYSDWRRVDGPVRCTPAGRTERQQCLWLNYDPEPLFAQ